MSGWLWVRADVRRRATSLVLLSLVVGLAGAVGIAAVAGARRTTTSWDRLRAAEGAPEISFFGELFEGPVTDEELDAVRDIPGAEVAGSTIVVLFPGLMGLERSGDMGLIIARDVRSLELATRSRHLEGRLPDPAHPEEVVVNEAVASELDLDVGDHLVLRSAPFEVFEACLATPDCTAREAPPVDVVVSGINRQSGDLDRDAFNKYLIYANAEIEALLTEEHPRVVFFGSVYLEDGTSAASWIEELEQRLPNRFGAEIADPASANVHDALRVEAQALLALAAIAAIAGLAAAAQGFARHLAASADDHRTLHALGMTRWGRTVALGSSGVLVAVGGTLVAIIGSLAASPLLPLGLAGRAEPDPGFDIDEIALGIGALVMLGVLVAVLSTLAWRHARARSDETDAARSLRPISGLPLAPALGAGLAFRGSRRGGLATGAVAGVVVALTLGLAATVLTASNDRLQADERLYGQPWEASMGVDPSVEAEFVADLAARPELGAVGVARSGEVLVDGGDADPTAVFAVGFARTRGDLPVVVLAGREPAARDEVAMGTELLDDLGLSVGDDLVTADGTPLRIVGRVVVPIVGGDFPDDGLLLTLDGFEAHASRDVAGETIESLAVFRAADGEDIDELLAEDLGNAARFGAARARQPSDVTNLQGIGRLPLQVGALTALLAGLALAHALLVTERGSRRELATLRAFGMRQGDLAVVLLSAGVTLALIGLLLGVPLGIIAGRLLWTAIADSVLFLALPTVPVGSLVVAVVLTALVAVLATAIPAVRAHSLRPALALREQ